MESAPTYLIRGALEIQYDRIQIHSSRLCAMKSIYFRWKNAKHKLSQCEDETEDTCRHQQLVRRIEVYV